MSLLNLFRPKWKNSDPQVRLNEVRSLPIESNQPPFIELARKDEDPRVRSAAASRIFDIEVLIELWNAENDSHVKQSIRRRLEDRIEDQILDSNASVHWVQFIQENRILENTALKAPSQVIRQALVSKINKETFLADWIQQESDSKIALEIFQKLSKEESLRKALKSSHKEITSKAQTQLDVLEQKRQAQEEQKRQNAQLDAILSALKRLESSLDLIQHEDEFYTLQSAWKDLSTKVQSREPESMLQSLSHKLNEQKAQLEAKAKESAAQKAWMDRAQEICEQLEELCKNGQTEQALLAQDLNDLWSTHSAQASSHWDFARSWSDRFERSMDNWEIRLDRLLQAQAQVASPEEPEVLSQETTDSAPTLSVEDQTLSKLISDKSAQLEAIILSVQQLDPNGEFESVQEALRIAHTKWKEISADHREQFIGLWKKFKEACIPFEEIGQWAKWHNEQKKQNLVDEIEALVKSDKSESEVYAEYRTLQESWKAAGSISHEKHQELWGRFKTATDQIIQRCQAFFEQRNAERDQNLALKKQLCSEIASAIQAEQKAEEGDLLKAFQERWKKIGPVPREHNDSIWQEYRGLCDQLYAKRKELYQVEHDHRVQNLKLKENLCLKAEDLQNSEDWAEGAKTVRQLQEDWKKIGFVPKADSEQIWHRFRVACDSFFERKRKHFEEVDAQKKTNFDAKVKLCEAIESMASTELSTELLAKVDALKEEWKGIGHVAKEDSDAIWDRFCRATDAILEKQAAQDPELKQEIARRVNLKQEIIEKAKEIGESSDWATASNSLQDLQNQWREIGRAGVSDQDLWNSFRKVCDAFFERKRDHYEIMEQHRINNLDEKIALIEEAERIAAGGHDDQARREIKQLRHRWKEIGQVPRKHADKIWKRFNKACDAVFALENQEQE